ncbi:MAG: SpoIIE family protein phosphatase [Candidatus Caenarcaniphilales bacterium]|nr:SpoIIE family protein phosphatase [Candidatus Caenarcaniphilales bacterium]
MEENIQTTDQNIEDLNDNDDLKKQLCELSTQLEEERRLNTEKTAMMEKTLAETERLSLYLQNTTFALMQERQAAHALAERERLLNQWIEKVNSSLNITHILKYLTKQMAKFFKVSRCGIVFLQGNKFQVVEFCEDEHGRNLEYNLLRKDEFFFKILRCKTPIQYEEIDNSLSIHFLEKVNSFLSVPLLLRNEVLGLIYLQDCSGFNNWQDNDIQLLQAISYPLMTAIERARLFKKSHERTKQAELLNSLTSQIRSSLNLKDILSRTVNELGFALKVSRCLLFIKDHISEEFCATGVSSIAKDTKHLILDKLSDQEDEFSTIIMENLISTDNLSKLNHEEKQALINSQARSAMATPLFAQGELKGWIVFQSLFPRAWTEDEVTFIEAAASQVIVAMTQSEIYEQLNNYQSRISRELKQAARVQSSLIGGDILKTSMNISVLYKPHSNVSGDFYWVSELSPNKVGVLIGDVSGKGPAAALLTGYILGQFNSIIENAAHAWAPEKVISFLCDSLLAQSNNSDFYATAWYGVFDLTTGELRYTNAGHLKPYIIKDKQARMLDTSDNTGVPLGLIDPREVDAFYHCQTLQLSPGDKLILFTDGFMEQTLIDESNPTDDWMFNTLKTMTDTDVKDITSGLNNELNKRLGTNSLTDDRLLICLEQRDFKLNKVDMSDYNNCDAYIKQIIDGCKSKGLEEQNSLILRLGLTEAFANVAQYGVKAQQDTNVDVGYEIRKGSLKIVIKDPGNGFNWHKHKFLSIDEVNVESEGGRGIPLLREIFDKITWNYLGNHMGLFFYW